MGDELMRHRYGKYKVKYRASLHKTGGRITVLGESQRERMVYVLSTHKFPQGPQICSPFLSLPLICLPQVKIVIRALMVDSVRGSRVYFSYLLGGNSNSPVYSTGLS